MGSTEIPMMAMTTRREILPDHREVPEKVARPTQRGPTQSDAAQNAHVRNAGRASPHAGHEWREGPEDREGSGQE